MRPTISIGMAHHSDPDGVYFTIQSLKLHHPEIMPRVELIVVDNNPKAPEAQQLGNFLGWSFGETAEARLRENSPRPYTLGGIKYISMGDVTGTSAPRDRIFREAAGEWVMCIDCHVMFRPGTIAKLVEWCERNRNFKGLFQGPLLYDDLRTETASTHFNDVWRSEMWGIWGTAWECQCKQGMLTTVEMNNLVQFRDLASQHAATECPHCGMKLPQGIAWPQHELRLKELGLTQAMANPTCPPFEIPGQGLGLFGCRKDAWLGFNPKFRGFGGEEMYIHEKYRQHGQRTLCLPFLQWSHRFWRPRGAQYPNTLWLKARNYVIGHAELGLPLDRLKRQFVDNLNDDGTPCRQNHAGPLVPAHEWEQLAKDPSDPPEWPITQASTVQPTPACGSCGGNAIDDKLTLDDLYDAAFRTASDINEHCPKLRELASKSKVVVDMGMRAKASTVALLAGQPEKLVVVSPSEDPVVKALAKRAGKTEMQVVIGDSLNVDIPECDLLFIDTRHTGEHFVKELERHASKAKRIARHDTQIYGERGEDGTPGLLAGLRQFLRAHPEWTVVSCVQNNYGFTVISRDPTDKKQRPSKLVQAFNYAKAVKEHILDGSKNVSPEQYQERLDVCSMCEVRNSEHCGQCGCPIQAKASWRSETCPIGKWPEIKAAI